MTARELRSLHGELAGELESLCQRRSTIPRQILAVREASCEALAIPLDNLLFAGELLQVPEAERA